MTTARSTRGLSRPILFLASLFITASCGRLGAPHAAEVAPKVTVVRAAHVIDVRNGKTLDRALVVIRGDRISAVGVELPIPAGAEVIDLGAATLLPGLIDVHTHVMASMESSYVEDLARKPQTYRALEGAANAKAMLYAGFTTVRDCENEGSGFADVSLRDAVNNGLVEGPRLLVATRAIAAIGGYSPFGVSSDLRATFPTGAQMISGAEEARRAAREQIQNGADLIKLYADFVQPPSSYLAGNTQTTLTVDEMKAVVDVAHAAGRRVAAHAMSGPGIRNALAAGVDSIEHGTFADKELLLLMRQKNAFLVPTAAAVSEKPPAFPSETWRLRYEANVAQLRRLVPMARDVGVRIASGFDADERAKHGRNAAEPVLLKELGLTPIEALRASTSTAAELIGWEDRVGAIEPGKLADLVATAGNPLNDIHELERVRFVMKGGAVVVRR